MVVKGAVLELGLHMSFANCHEIRREQRHVGSRPLGMLAVLEYF